MHNKRKLIVLMVYCVCVFATQRDMSPSHAEKTSTPKPVPRKRTFSDSRTFVEAGLTAAYWSKSANEGEEWVAYYLLRLIIHVRVVQWLKTRWQCMTNALIKRFHCSSNTSHTPYTCRSPGMSTWPIQFQWFSSLTESLLFCNQKTANRPENVNTTKK